MVILRTAKQRIGAWTAGHVGRGVLAVVRTSGWAVSTCAYALGCLIACDGIGPLGAQATRLLLIVCLGVFTAFELSGQGGIFPLRRLLVVPAFAAAGWAPSELLATAPVLVALGAARSRSDPAVLWRLGGLAAFVVLRKAYLAFPAGWYASERLAHLMSSLVSPFVPWRVQLGPSALGLPALAFFACMLFAGVPLLRQSRSGRRSLAAAGVILALLYAIELAVRVRVLFLSSPNMHTAWMANAVLYALMALCLWPLHIVRDLGAPTTDRARGTTPAWAAWVTAAAVVLFAVVLQRPVGSGGTVVILKDGAIPWGLPDPPYAVGRLSDGKVGLIEHYLKSIGFRVKWHEGKITPSVLRGAKVLLTINLNRRLDRQETEAVWAFVRRGGGLLVCGDHTDYVGLVGNYGRLLERVGIGFNFDSAVPIAGAELWRAALEHRPSPLARDWSPVEMSVSIGASLSVRPPAVPLIVGRYGFSDPGDRAQAATGCLGNLAYDRGERLGDVVLAAAAQYGRGKVLVFGDTSSFMNYSLPSSYRFVGAVFRWLADSRARVTVPLAIYLLVAGLAVVVVLSRRCAVWHLAGALALMCVALPLGRPASVPMPDTRMLAVVDVSHLAPLPLFPGPDSALAGMNRALMRRGYLPVVMPRWDGRLVDRARLVILPGPARDFSAVELADLRQLSERGGHLLACIGTESSWLTPSLLRYLGVQIEPVPLGNADGKRVSNISYDVPLHFVSAWPVYGAGYRTVYQAWGYPVVIGGYRGKGRVAVIGDSRFPLGDNLEGDYSFYEGNLWLFNTLTEP